ncbi:MAG TPA: histidine phosphotransferase family protein, partial [Acetobacteraceae bacterium]
MDEALRLAELLTTRLCHDLAGPINTLTGALELAAEDAEAAGEALPLAEDAAMSLARRLKLVRMAWGGGGAAQSAADLRELAAGLQGSKLRLDFDGLVPDAVFPPAVARVVLNVLLLGAECLRMGGTLRLAGDPEGDMIVTIDGPRAAWPPGFAALLANP